MTRWLGVDGCRAGWVAIFQEGGALNYSIVPTFGRLVESFPAPEAVLIDIPIGLPTSASPTRACDLAARRVLGPRRSSVFSAPSRHALRAGGVDIARTRNIEHLGRSLSAQSYAICPKIAEVDEYLREHRNLCQRYLEMHPEVCFWALNGNVPMRFPKRRPEGAQERVQLLHRYLPGIENLLTRVLHETARTQVQADDVLDAAVGYATVSIANGRLSRLGSASLLDDCGLPMQMVYAPVAG